MKIINSFHRNKVSISVLTSLYRCEKYLEKYFSHVLEIVNLQEVEFIFIHNDPTEEEKSIIYKALRNNEQINYQYIEVEREGLYKSWNRGVNIAQGEFVAVWNVDDIRYPESLKIQEEALKKNCKAGLVYGNRHEAYSLLNKKPILIITEDISSSSWNRKFQDGAFVMWRKQILLDVGLFDEQFRSAGDTDMWYRIALNYDIVKVDYTVGLFYRHNESISSNSSHGENFVIGMRYGFFKPSQFKNPLKGLKTIKPYPIVNEWTDKKITILCYKSLHIYAYSLYNLIIFLKGIARFFTKKIFTKYKGNT